MLLGKLKVIAKDALSAIGKVTKSSKEIYMVGYGVVFPNKVAYVNKIVYKAILLQEINYCDK